MPPQATASRVVAMLAMAASALFSGRDAGAAGGWAQDYEYPGRGAGWYGAMALYELRRDFAPTTLEQATDGDDYGRGYDALFDPYGFGPPAQSTDVSRHEYVFRFGSFPIVPYGCAFDSECTDFVFCNGAERCASDGECVPGAVPSCDDQDPCTDDACAAVRDNCEWTVLTAAREVQSLLLGRAAPGSPVASLNWQPGVEASRYNVYRSTDVSGDFGCFLDGLRDPFVDDDGFVPVSGRQMAYLVTAVGCGGEGTAGNDSLDRPRLISQPCP